MLEGAGAGFPAFMHTQSLDLFSKANPNISISYSQVGSARGAYEFVNGNTDFAITSAPFHFVGSGKTDNRFLEVPVAATSIAVVYNLKDVGNLKLSRDALAGIFDGSIVNWSDPVILRDNQGAALPDLPIEIIARGIGSGSTFAFTNHIKEYSAVWRKIGASMDIAALLPANARYVSSNYELVKSIGEDIGSIGFVPVAYSITNGTQVALLQNKSGEYVAPTVRATQKALSHLKVVPPPELNLLLIDPEGPEAYPIVTFYWLFIDKHYKNTKKAAAVRALATFMLEGLPKKTALALGYVSLPKAVRLDAVNLLKSDEK